MESRKIIYIDVETTGTDDSKHGLIQLGGIVEIDGEEADRIDLLISPFPQDVIEEEALIVNKRTKEEIMEFDTPLSQYLKFIELLNGYIDKYDKRDKFHFVGYNSRFDEGFLRSWFKKNNDNYYGSYFFWPSVDVANMAAVHFMETRNTFVNFKLMTVAESAGIEVDKSKAHDAMYDIEITKDLFKNLLDRRKQDGI